MPDQFEIAQSAKYEGDNWWTWAVWIEGQDQALNEVECVEWTLHPTFPNPIRKTKDRAKKFRLETGGWGAFQIVARVQLKSGTPIKLRHHLQLHYPDGTQTTA